MRLQLKIGSHTIIFTHVMLGKGLQNKLMLIKAKKE